MQLEFVDWVIMGAYFAVALIIGLSASRSSGQDFSSFFLGGRKMPWWLLGVSMVATTFSTDTPNLVSDIVRSNGTFGNWTWWAFLLTGMLTVFLYAKLWRRSRGRAFPSREVTPRHLLNLKSSRRDFVRLAQDRRAYALPLRP